MRFLFCVKVFFFSLALQWTSGLTAQDELLVIPEWQQLQVQKRKTLLDMVGPFPQKTPLHPRILGTIAKEGYRIENIVFESQPGFYVTSSLFIPDGKKQTGRAPAILYVSGHSDPAYRGAYAHVIVNLVKKGFIVFAYDPVGQGERKTYFDPDSGRSVVGSVTREHAFVSAPAFMKHIIKRKTFKWYRTLPCMHPP